MKTAFALRIDKEEVINGQIDNDFFNNSARSSKLVQLEKAVADLEA